MQQHHNYHSVDGSRLDFCIQMIYYGRCKFVVVCSLNKVEENPFWRPTTLDELEEFGDTVAEKNNTRIVVDKVC
jgi:hypothetical protein